MNEEWRQRDDGTWEPVYDPNRKNEPEIDFNPPEFPEEDYDFREVICAIGV